jgi:hypothetical protein
METVQAQEELIFIRKVMEDSRIAYIDDSKPKLLWVAITALGLLYTYAQALEDGDLYVGWIWLGIAAFGLGYIFWTHRQNNRIIRVQTHTGKIIATIWGACGFSIACIIALVFGALYLKIDKLMHPLALCPITAIIIGIAYYLDGTLRVVRWVRNLAYIWWLGAGIMFIFPTIHILLMVALMLLVFQLLPGIILYKRSKITAIS